MRTAYAKLFARLEGQKLNMLAEVGHWPEAHMRFRPNDVSWSALDVLDHLQRTESGILAQMRKQLAAGLSVSLKDRLGSLFILTLFRLPTRVRIPPSVSSIHPSTSTTLDEVERCWSQTRLDLSNFLRVMPEEEVSRGLFRHPVGGWMNVATTLAFLGAHIVHHRFQLKRIERSWRSQP